MSKVSMAEQGLGKDSLYLEAEDLYRTVVKVWNELPLETIARSYLGHHQLVNVIYRGRRSDDFV